MATGINGIATVSELIFGKGLTQPISGQPYEDNKCPTAYEVSTMQGTTSGYQANQLVKYSDVSNRTIQFALTIRTSITYSSLALFPVNGIPNPAYSYTLLSSVAPKNYVIIFNQGAGIKVNNPNYPTTTMNIYSGSQYRVFGKVNAGSSWTLIATLTHVDNDKLELI